MKTEQIKKLWSLGALLILLISLGGCPKNDDEGKNGKNDDGEKEENTETETKETGEFKIVYKSQILDGEKFTESDIASVTTKDKILIIKLEIQRELKKAYKKAGKHKDKYGKIVIHKAGDAADTTTTWEPVSVSVMNGITISGSGSATTGDEFKIEINGTNKFTDPNISAKNTTDKKIIFSGKTKGGTKNDVIIKVTKLKDPGKNTEKTKQFKTDTMNNSIQYNLD